MNTPTRLAHIIAWLCMIAINLKVIAACGTALLTVLLIAISACLLSLNIYGLFRKALSERSKGANR